MREKLKRVFGVESVWEEREAAWRESVLRPAQDGGGGGGAGGWEC